MCAVKVLLAPDKFKGSLTAVQFCKAACTGLQKIDPTIECVFHPLADGGEGTLEALAGSLPLQTIELTVNDPLFRPITASYMIDDHAAYIEMSRASGLQLLTDHEINCMQTTSYGTGEMIRDALNRGINQVYLFIGGSATNDAGIGIAAALGYRLLDQSCVELRPIGASLPDLYALDDHDVVIPEGVQITVVCDVKNRLFGPDGAAYVYGPQKGASPSEVKLLDEGLVNFNEIVKGQYQVDLSKIVGGGAAGGIGAGAVGLLNATIKTGIETVMEITGFDARLKEIDLVITGEGKLDKQTLQGKVVAGVYQKVRAVKKSMYVICGVAEDVADLQATLDVPVLELKTPEIQVEEAMKNAAQLVQERMAAVLQDYHSSGE